MRFTFHLTTGDYSEAGNKKFFANIVLRFYFLLHLVMMGFEVCWLTRGSYFWFIDLIFIIYLDLLQGKTVSVYKKCWSGI
jgi:hypothetical protein